jgi:uncharacterized alpha/beta hydrolase family protein
LELITYITRSKVKTIYFTWSKGHADKFNQHPVIEIGTNIKYNSPQLSISYHRKLVKNKNEKYNIKIKNQQNVKNIIL